MQERRNTAHNSRNRNRGVLGRGTAVIPGFIGQAVRWYEPVGKATAGKPTLLATNFFMQSLGSSRSTVQICRERIPPDVATAAK